MSTCVRSIVLCTSFEVIRSPVQVDQSTHLAFEPSLAHEPTLPPTNRKQLQLHGWTTISPPPLLEEEDLGLVAVGDKNSTKKNMN